MPISDPHPFGYPPYQITATQPYWTTGTNATTISGAWTTALPAPASPNEARAREVAALEPRDVEMMVKYLLAGGPYPPAGRIVNISSPLDRDASYFHMETSVGAAASWMCTNTMRGHFANSYVAQTIDQYVAQAQHFLVDWHRDKRAHQARQQAPPHIKIVPNKGTDPKSDENEDIRWLREQVDEICALAEIG